MRASEYFLVTLTASTLIAPGLRSWAAPTPPARGIEQIYAVAKDTKGKVVYREKHEIESGADNIPSAAKTEYSDSADNLRATLTSSFGGDLAAPDYTFVDAKDGSSHGVIVKPSGYLLWKKSKDGAKKEKLIPKQTFAPGQLVVSGQGLFFYLRKNLRRAVQEGPASVKLLVPGQLDFFSFTLLPETTDPRLVTFHLRADSLFVRLFVSSLTFKFDLGSGQLLHYEGPTNLVDESGDPQKVEITYSPSPHSDGAFLTQAQGADQ